MKKTFSVVWEFLQVVLISLIIIIPIRYYVIQPFFVKGASMEPAFQDGDYLIVDEFSYHFRSPERGEVIVFRYPQDQKQFYIKRVIGLPGETVQVANNQILIKNSDHPKGFILDESEYLSMSTPGNVEKTLGDNQYFVVGDNRDHSFDSRGWGELEKDLIIGKALFRVWPIDTASAFSSPEYLIP